VVSLVSESDRPRVFANSIEPAGIVEVKLRQPKLLALMARTDSELAGLQKQAADASASADDRAAAQAKCDARIQHLLPAYQSVALQFADLHDRAGRVEAKGCGERLVWKESRRKLYWRLRRKLNEQVSPFLQSALCLTFAAHLQEALDCQPQLDLPRTCCSPS
jgi:hypothetical protein